MENNKLNEKEPQELIDFMITKANEAKRAQYDIARFQTSDYEATS